MYIPREACFVFNQSTSNSVDFSITRRRRPDPKLLEIGQLSRSVLQLRCAQEEITSPWEIEMVKTRRGWYLVDIKTDEDDRRKKDEKEAALEARRGSMVKRCDDKIARRRNGATEQREAILAEELSPAQAAVEAKEEDIEVTHRLAAELSRRKSEEIKRALKSTRVKSSVRSPPNCALSEAQSRLIEGKVRLEASQAELLRLWQQDKTVEKLQQAEDEDKKRNSRIDQQHQLADNHRRVEERRTEEKKRDRKMMEQAMRKTQEEDAKTKKKKDDTILLKIEMAASLAAKNAWEKKYKEALKDEDEKIARVIAEKARQEKQFGMKTEFYAAREAAIDNVARKLLANVCKEKRRQKIVDELYREEQRSKWAKDSTKPASKKQYAIAECFQEIARQKAEHKAKDEAIDAASARYLAEEREKDIKKRKEDDNARHAKKIQYGEELKEVITNNRVAYAVDILERQSETCAHDKNANRLTTTSVKEPNDRNDNNKIARRSN